MKPKDINVLCNKVSVELYLEMSNRVRRIVYTEVELPVFDLVYRRVIDAAQEQMFRVFRNFNDDEPKEDK